MSHSRQHDQMGEALGEVFALAARDGESMNKWTARVLETFERWCWKAAVDFPKEACGWIALHCSGLKRGTESDHQGQDAGQAGLGDRQRWHPVMFRFDEGQRLSDQTAYSGVAG